MTAILRTLSFMMSPVAALRVEPPGFGRYIPLARISFGLTSCIRGRNPSNQRRSGPKVPRKLATNGMFRTNGYKSWSATRPDRLRRKISCVHPVLVVARSVPASARASHLDGCSVGPCGQELVVWTPLTRYQGNTFLIAMKVLGESASDRVVTLNIDV